MSGPLGSLALRLTTLTKERKPSDRIRRILRLAAEHKVDCVVVGLPLEMDGDEGEAARNARAFAEQLSSRTDLAVELIDERLTSVEAEEEMRRAGLDRAQRKASVDEVAAVIILRSWISREEHREASS